MKKLSNIIALSVIVIAVAVGIFHFARRTSDANAHYENADEQTEISQDDPQNNLDNTYVDLGHTDAGYENADEYSATDDTQAGITLDELLYDFDFMMQMMEYSFPFFGVAERRFGTDLRQLALETRYSIISYPYIASARLIAEDWGIALEDMPPMNELIFWEIVNREFFQRISPGVPSFHAGMMHALVIEHMTAGGGRVLVHDRNRHQETSSFRVAQMLFIAQLSATQSFYEDQMRIFENQINALLNTSYGDEFDYDDFDDFLSSLRENAAHFTTARLPMTDILDEGRIAYVAMPTFSMSMEEMFYSKYMLMEFYREIQDFEHLIIDIRNNGGGLGGLGNVLTIYPLWPDRENIPDMPFYAFFSESDFSWSIAEFTINNSLPDIYRYSWTMRGYLPTADELFPVTDATVAHLPELNETDAQGLAYGIRININPLHTGRGIFMGFNMPHIPFNGQIWLLINERNGSAAAMFARQAKYMDFAILVGEQIVGSYSIGWPVLILPNTGIIVNWDITYMTDAYGRAFEEFPTTPHYFNRDGYDALETVLQMIEEGGGSRDR